MQPQLEIATLGQVCIRLNDEPIDHKLSAKGKGMVIYLAANRHAHSRDKFATYFMEDMQPAASFRRELSELKHTLGNCLEKTYTMVKLCDDLVCRFDGYLLERHIPELCRTPIEKMTPALIKQLEELLLMYKGDFLDGLYINTVEFQMWSAFLDINYRSLVITGWDRVIDYYIFMRDYQRGLLQCMRLLQADDLRSQSYHKMMITLASLDQRRAAMEVYEKARQRLKEDLGVEPMPETVALYEQIRQGKFRPPHGDERT